MLRRALLSASQNNCEEEWFIWWIVVLGQAVALVCTCVFEVFGCLACKVSAERSRKESESNTWISTPTNGHEGRVDKAQDFLERLRFGVLRCVFESARSTRGLQALL